MNNQGTNATTQSLWATRCPRFGMVLIVRRVHGGVELVLFDPASRFNGLKDHHYHANKLALMQFKGELLELLGKTMEIPLVGAWIGGCPTRYDAGWDTLQVCCEWVRGFVSGKDHEGSFPTTEAGWNDAGFSRWNI